MMYKSDKVVIGEFSPRKVFEIKKSYIPDEIFNALKFQDEDFVEFDNLIQAVNQGKLRISRFIHIVSSKKGIELTDDEISNLSKIYSQTNSLYEIYETSPLILKDPEYEGFGDEKSCFVNNTEIDKSVAPFWLELLGGKVFLVFKNKRPYGRFLGLPVILQRVVKEETLKALDYEGSIDWVWEEFDFEEEENMVYFNYYGLEDTEMELILYNIPTPKYNKRQLMTVKEFNPPLYINHNLGYIIIDGDRVYKHYHPLEGGNLTFYVKCPVCGKLTYLDELNFKAIRATHLTNNQRYRDILEKINLHLIKYFGYVGFEAAPTGIRCYECDD